MIVIEVLSWNFLDEDYVISVLLLFVYTSDTLQVNTYKYLIIGTKMPDAFMTPLIQIR